MHKIRQVMLSAAAFLAFSGVSLAQMQRADEGEIRSIVHSEGEAWNNGDAKAFAEHYAGNGIFTDEVGRQLYGRKAFIAQHANTFSTVYKGSHNDLSVSKVTFLRPDVALVEIDGTLTGAARMPPGLKAFEDGSMHVRLLEVMTKEKGDWWIAAFHNVAVYPTSPGSQTK